MAAALKLVLLFCTPAVPPLLASAVCPMSAEAGRTVVARPPPAAFAIVWPLLFVGLGASLCRLDCKWPIIVASLCLGFWSPLYSQECGADPRRACWILVLCSFAAIVALAMATREGDAVSIVALSALVAWLLFAQQLSALEVQSI
jgi:tryptophan-rich sensory protein